MRIAYIAPYQGPGLIERRQTLNNLGLAANVKIELISELLQRSGHTIEIISQGEIVDRRNKFYPCFQEPKPFNDNIPVFYGSALPIKRVNAIWPTLSTIRLFRRRHKESPFDAVIVYNLQLPQTICGLYAGRHLRLPLILDYEDDSFVDICGNDVGGGFNGVCLRLARKLLERIDGGIGVSPFLLSRMADSIPKVLLRGVVGEEMRNVDENAPNRNKWVVFSGTHRETKGLEQLILAWKQINVTGWELHIAGYGAKTDDYKKIAASDKTIFFHGSLDREKNAALLRRCTIGTNPHELSVTPGNVFAFKVIECLAAGTHVISTRMGPLESELEAGITYIPDNKPETIAAALQHVIRNREYERKAAAAAYNMYGPSAVAQSLNALLSQVVSRKEARTVPVVFERSVR